MTIVIYIRRCKQNLVFSQHSLGFCCFSIFIISSMEKSSQQVIQRHQRMKLDRQDSVDFVEAIINSPEPSTRLIEAARKYREIMGE